MYEEYFQMLNDVRSEGWWTRRENRAELEWLAKAYPVKAAYVDGERSPKGWWE
jgi:hypothetical protein